MSDSESLCSARTAGRGDERNGFIKSARFDLGDSCVSETDHRGGVEVKDEQSVVFLFSNRFWTNL